MYSLNRLSLCRTTADKILAVNSIEFDCMQWSPDGRLLLFGSASGEVVVYDTNGNFLVILLYPGIPKFLTDCCRNTECGRLVEMNA